jgi:hypothetical protein
VPSSNYEQCQPVIKTGKATKNAREEPEWRGREIVAVLIFNEVEILDFCDPFEVFSVTGKRNNLNPFNIYTVTEKAKPVE